MSTPNDSPADSALGACAQLLSLAVHELRTPASVVSGYLRMLQRDSDAPLSDRQRKMVDEAEKSCTRLVALIAEMSEVSKLDAGVVQLGRESFDLFRLVQEVAEGVHEAEERGVRLDVRGETAGAGMVGDAARWRSALTAIFRAILREQGSACTVVVDRRVDRRGNVPTGVVLIAPEACVQRAYETDRGVFEEKRGGLGLALPIARRVIERQGGSVWAPELGDERGAAGVSVPLAELKR